MSGKHLPWKNPRSKSPTKRRNEGAYSQTTVKLYRAGFGKTLLDADKLEKKLKRGGMSSRKIEGLAAGKRRR